MGQKLSQRRSLMLRGGEVAIELGISRAQAYKWMKEGVLPTVRHGKTVRVPRAALLAWIERHTQGAGGLLTPSAQDASNPDPRVIALRVTGSAPRDERPFPEVGHERLNLSAPESEDSW